MSVRLRFDGTANQLAMALMPLAVLRGKYFVKYPEPETKKLEDAKICVDSIVSHCDVLEVCYKHQPNLTFKKSTVEACMEIIGRDHQSKWG